MAGVKQGTKMVLLTPKVRIVLGIQGPHPAQTPRVVHLEKGVWEVTMSSVSGYRMSSPFSIEKPVQDGQNSPTPNPNPNRPQNPSKVHWSSLGELHFQILCESGAGRACSRG
jgi:hypothetical protein